ncbi:BH0509 family protein [Anaerobacillus sp. MEB173]
MSRQERKNMVHFIERTRGIEQQQLMYMTDDEIEHIYNATYSRLENEE